MQMPNNQVVIFADPSKVCSPAGASSSGADARASRAVTRAAIAIATLGR